ncbi:MAG: SurA N-terminal domain-containing protein [Elusimicrobiota bacterium]|jgi:parvulin-like peptidyl-prolyl isomerase|nr:SurA N-terminal domain-containing protein [Elusimicrobiota bacterium]
MKVNKTTVLAAALLLAAAFAAAKVVDTTVATVNNKAILSSEYGKLTKSVLEEYNKNAPKLLENKDNVTAIEEEVLNQMITDSLLTQAAKDEGIKVKDSELAEGINEIKARFRRSADGNEITDKKLVEKAFNDELKREGLTYKQFEDKIRNQIAVRKLIDAVVKAKAQQPVKEDVKKLYDNIQIIMKGNQKEIEKLPKPELEAAVPLAAKLTQLTAEQIKVSPIFIKADATMSEPVRKDKEKLAKDIKKQLDGGEITFLEAIEKYSDDKSPLATGGEAVLVRGVMPKDFDNKVFAIAVGKVGGPIKTEQGFYIIRVNEKKAKKEISLPMIEADLAQYLTSVNMQKTTLDYLAQLKEKADIKVLVKFNYEKPAQAQPAAAAPVTSGATDAKKDAPKTEPTATAADAKKDAPKTEAKK